MTIWRRNQWPAVVLVAALLTGSVACEDVGRDEVAASRPIVAVSIFPLADLVGQMVGDRAEVVTLLPPGMSPHGYETRPGQARKIARAKLMVTVGLHVDDWATRAAEAVGGDVPVFVFADAVGIDGGEAHADRGRHDEHGHGMVNPHLWLDPVLVKRMVPALAGALVEALPEHAAAIEANAEELDGALADLDAEFERRLAPLHDAEMITYHSAFDLLAERYGLTVAATLTPVESPGDLTSGRLAEVIRLIRDHEVRSVFTEPQFPAERAAAIQRETGVEVLVLDPLGDPNQPGRDGYFALMRYNLDTLLKGLGRDE